MVKKGFTLIELLAVILILGIIALIAIPTVTDIIEDSKKSALKSSANNLLRSAEQQCNIQRMIGNKITNTYTITSGNISNTLNIKNLPDSGIINIDEDCNATLAIVEGNYCAVADGDSVIINTNTIHCIEENIRPTSKECFVFDSTTGTIIDYNNEDITCPSDVVTPKKIDGVNVVNIGAEAFRENQLTSVIILNSVTSIGAGAFSQNYLTSVTIPSSVTSIGESAFWDNDLTSINIPNSVTSIGAGAFSQNYLTSVTIPSSVTSIGEGAFWDNDLTSINIPNSVTSIERETFAGNNLTGIIIPNSVTSIGAGAFWDNNLTSVTIPDSVTSIGSMAFNDNQLPDNQAFIYKRNNDGSVDNTAIISYGGAKRDNVEIPNGVTSIEDDAFRDNNLTSVTIPNSVTSVGYDAFNLNSLTSVTIGSGITTIQNNAFLNNTGGTININKPKNSVANAPWGATNFTINWAKVCKATTGDGTHIGDVIKCGTSQFYVYAVTSNSIKMLAKDILNVGTTAFSNTNNAYSGSIVKQYVDSYAQQLTNIGVTIQQARLITKEELEELVNSGNSLSTGQATIKNKANALNREWIYSTNYSYWTGTAKQSATNSVYYVTDNGGFYITSYSTADKNSVRPVIIISKSEI